MGIVSLFRLPCFIGSKLQFTVMVSRTGSVCQWQEVTVVCVCVAKNENERECEMCDAWPKPNQNAFFNCGIEFSSLSLSRSRSRSLLVCQPAIITGRGVRTSAFCPISCSCYCYFPQWALAINRSCLESSSHALNTSECQLIGLWHLENDISSALKCRSA